jgi:6-bladed beta-propeller
MEMKRLMVLAMAGLTCLSAGSASFTRAETAAGIAHVFNTAVPAADRETMVLKELWRTGGEDDEIFYGTIGTITSDQEGSVFILDTQMSQVQVFDPAGQWIGSLSREGEGPGETRNPEGLYIDQVGRICLLHSPVGSIMRINRDNTPAEPTAFSTGDGKDGGVTILLGAHAVGEGVVISGMRLHFGDDGRSRRHYFLTLCDAEGVQQTVLHEKDDFVDYTDFRLDEQSMDFCWNRWTCGQDGKIYVAPERNNYRIDVYDGQGNLEKVISREYESLERDDYLTNRATMVVKGVAAYHRTPLQGLTIEKVEPDIRGLWVDEAGFLWVRTSRGLVDKPEGAYDVVDVFAPDGSFAKQVAIMSDAVPFKDSLSFLDDGRVVAVIGSLDAWLTQQAVEQDDGGNDEVQALEVIVYGQE